jgi:hypothetical protein
VIRKTILFSLCISVCAFGANSALGIVTASGHFTLDRAQVWGNATLFDGSVVETGAASSEIALRNGVKFQLAKESRARISAGRVVMEKGAGQISAPESFELDAANLRLHTTGRMRVSLGATIEIASLTGSARVASMSGLVLAAIPAGRAMTFTLQAASGEVKRTGCLLFKDNHFIMQDENTQEVIEVTGQNFAAHVGNRVEIVGTASPGKPAVNIATLVVNVASVTPKSTGGCLSVASTLNAKTELPANGAAQPAAETPKSGGMSTGAKIAIIGAIAGGGAGAAIALASKKSSTSP